MSLVVAGHAAADWAPRAIDAVPRGQQVASSPDGIVGISEHVRRLRSWCASVGPLSCRVVIIGETGTGKGMVARLLHRCSALPGAFVERGPGETTPTLLEDALFGHVRGAFTGAHERRVGLLEAAHGGSFFLDEVQDVLPEHQRSLLLFLDGRGFAPLGSHRRVFPEVRFLAATQRPLPELIEEGKLRPDLLYRMREETITLQPLRERPEDVGPIAEAALRRMLAGRAEGVPQRLSAATLALLRRHPWPGNVRELEGAVGVAAQRAQGEAAIEPEHLPEWFFEELDTGPGAGSAGELGVQAVLLATHGNVTWAAKRVGVCPRTLRRRIAASGVDLAAIRREGAGCGSASGAVRVSE